MSRREMITAFSLILISIIIMVLIPFQVESVNASRPGNFINVTPRTFPFFLTGIMLILSIVNLAFAINNWRLQKHDGKTPEKMDLKSVLLVFIVLIIYVAIIDTLGYVLSTILLTLFLLKFFGAKLWQVIVIGILLPPILFYAFNYLYVPLPKGIFG